MMGSKQNKQTKDSNISAEPRVIMDPAAFLAPTLLRLWLDAFIDCALETQTVNS